MKKGLKIKQLRDALDIRQDHFAAILGYHQASISHIEKDDAYITEKFLKRLKEVFPEINMEYFRTGHGDMFLESQKEAMIMRCRDYIAKGGIKISGEVNKSDVSLIMNKETDDLRSEIQLLKMEITHLHKENAMLNNLVKSYEVTIRSKDELIAQLKK
jgi:transcriptional regulator with XRE-family HTH domain